MHQIAHDTSTAYGEGFRAANAAVNKYGLRRTLDHIHFTGAFPVWKALAQSHNFSWGAKWVTLLYVASKISTCKLSLEWCLKISNVCDWEMLWLLLIQTIIYSVTTCMGGKRLNEMFSHISYLLSSVIAFRYMCLAFWVMAMLLYGVFIGGWRPYRTRWLAHPLTDWIISNLYRINFILSFSLPSDRRSFSISPHQCFPIFPFNVENTFIWYPKQVFRLLH